MIRNHFRLKKKFVNKYLYCLGNFKTVNNGTCLTGVCVGSKPKHTQTNKQTKPKPKGKTKTNKQANTPQKQTNKQTNKTTIRQQQQKQQQ